MLKDSLSDLISSQSCSKECKFGKFLKSLDDETASILINAMAGEVSTMDLVRTLRSEGHPFSREYLGVKRNCFKDIDSAKSCCVAFFIKSATQHDFMKKANLYPKNGKK